jgi:hypothetical protein
MALGFEGRDQRAYAHNDDMAMALYPATEEAHEAGAGHHLDRR